MIDLLFIAQANWTPQMRQAAGRRCVQLGLQYGDHVTAEDYLRAAPRGIGEFAAFLAEMERQG